MLGTISGGHVIADGRVPGHKLKEIRVPLQLLKLAHVEASFFALLLITFHELDKAIRLGKRERAEEDAVDDGEDGGVRANAQSQGQYRDQSERWGFCQHAQAVSKVLPEGGHEAPRGTAGTGKLTWGLLTR